MSVLMVLVGINCCVILLLCNLLSHIEMRQYYYPLKMEKWTVLIPINAQQRPNLAITKIGAGWKEEVLKSGDIKSLYDKDLQIARIDPDQKEILLDEVVEWAKSGIITDDTETSGTMLVTVLDRKSERGDHVTLSFLLVGDRMFIDQDSLTID